MVMTMATGIVVLVVPAVVAGTVVVRTGSLLSVVTVVMTVVMGAGVPFR